MHNNVIKFEQATKQESFIELTGKRAEEVSKYWRVEILQFENKTLVETNYAVRLKQGDGSWPMIKLRFRYLLRKN